MLPIVHSSYLDEIFEDLLGVTFEVAVIRVMAVVEWDGFALGTEPDTSGCVMSGIHSEVHTRLDPVTEDGGRGFMPAGNALIVVSHRSPC